MTRFIGAAEYVADAGSITIGAGWVVGGRRMDGRLHVVARLEYLYYDLDNNPSLTGSISPWKLPSGYVHLVELSRSGLSAAASAISSELS